MKKDNPGGFNQPLPELFHPGCKVWLERGSTNFGDGLYYLLINVQKYGSISQAAREMGMSYRAAWGKIKRAERDWGFKLIATQVGGDAGGGASLTEDGEKLVTSFGNFRSGMDKELQRIFWESFS